MQFVTKSTLLLFYILFQVNKESVLTFITDQQKLL